MLAPTPLGTQKDNHQRAHVATVAILPTAGWPNAGDFMVWHIC